ASRNLCDVHDTINSRPCRRRLEPRTLDARLDLRFPARKLAIAARRHHVLLRSEAVLQFRLALRAQTSFLGLALLLSDALLIRLARLLGLPFRVPLAFLVH